MKVLKTEAQLSTPIESQMVGYNAAHDQYALKSAGEIKYVDSSYYSSLAGVVSGAEVVLLRGVGPHLHPLTESSKGGPGRARPRLEDPDRGACSGPGLRGLVMARVEGLGVGQASSGNCDR